ncbi:LacI family DNA-binding transcriptional regulator [uncultured Victivallis sp.]|uniref:LacI family DNA-binding transcriptional regulator n=1 Tax=uncultured Victivallis sp. TaxID=354118 RepID=UPI0025D7E19E|nr:LacI family DNA-binding transcriptional regulator [uncultured Victivallis sp.]
MRTAMVSNPGRMKSDVTMNDIAEYANVSQTTVSRVINNHPGINSATRQLVLDAMQKLNYRNCVHTRVAIALCPLPEQNDPLALDCFSSIVAGIQESFNPQEFDLSLQVLPFGAEELPKPENPQGVILLAYPGEQLRSHLRERKIPYVIASTDCYTQTEDLVAVDGFNAGVAGASWLLSSGRTRFGFLLTEYDLPRYAGFQMELMRRGVQIRPEDLRLVRDSEYSSFMEEAYQWLAQGDLPEVLVISYIDISIVIRKMLMMNHIRVPEDVLIFSFSHRPRKNSEIFYASFDPRLLGRRAALRLIEKFRSPDDSPIQIMIPMLPDENERKARTLNTLS